FGGVFVAGSPAFRGRDVPELSRLIEASMERWPMQRLVHRGEGVDVDGNGFSAIGRLALQQTLQGLCRRAGVSIHYARAVGSLDELAGVGAAGGGAAGRGVGGGERGARDARGGGRRTRVAP